MCRVANYASSQGFTTSETLTTALSHFSGEEASQNHFSGVETTPRYNPQETWGSLGLARRPRAAEALAEAQMKCRRGPLALR